MEAPGRAGGPDARAVWLLIATLVVAVASLIYELIAATISSYLLGDSIRQFSFVIGVFLFFMGVGAWASRFVAAALPGFVAVQVALGAIGGFTGPVLFLSYATFGVVGLPLYSALALIGCLSGMEIPLIARVLEKIGATRFRFENVLTADYVGALIASLAFPILIVPNLSLVAASLALGVMNLAVAGVTLWLFRDRLPRAVWPAWGAVLGACAVALALSGRLVGWIDALLFADDVVLTETTPYQQITVTRFGDRTRLYLDQSIQFDTRDEHRYHEMLVHPAMMLAPRRARVLILGGGDGLAAREVLRWDGVEAVTLVDLDPAVTRLFRDNPDLAALNDFSLSDPRLRVVNQDAWMWARQQDAVYDVMILDLPDPRTLSLSRLYSREFYRRLVEGLSPRGLLVTQAGSPLFATDAFWMVERTLAAIPSAATPGDNLATLPYHVYVPSFGEWGFVIAAPMPVADRPRADLPGGLRYLTGAVFDAAGVFPPETGPREGPVNTIRDHPLIDAYEAGWAYWFR